MTLTFNQAADLYLVDIKSRCAVSSYNHYRKRLRPFRVEFGDSRLTDISSEYVLMLIKELNKNSDGTLKAPDTIRSNVQGWEQMQTWLLEQGHLTEAITAKKIKKPGGRKREIIPTKDETHAIVENANPEFMRIFRALRLTGARPGELCKAQIKDIDPITGEIVLTEHKTSRKTGKPRRIAIGHPALQEIIRESIAGRREGHIFLMKSGRPWRTEYISRIYREARESHGLRKGLVLYLSRHEHATQLYKTTGDLKAVADALGHANIQTTMRYTRVDSDQLKKNQQLFNEGLD